MNNKILFKFSFENGWGDTFLSVFDIVNCVDFLKNQYPNFQFILLINDKYNVKTLEEVLNIDFFNEFFDEFKILNKDNLFVSVNGFSTYGDIEYKRLYSGRNNDVFNDINGIFDVYVPTSNYDDVKNFCISPLGLVLPRVAEDGNPLPSTRLVSTKVSGQEQIL